VCHLRNDVTARFCRQCGLPLGAPRDPVRGTTTRRADLPSDRGAGIAAVISLAAIVVIAGIAGFLVFRGFDTTTTAGASATTSAPPASSGAPAVTEPPTPSDDPVIVDPTASPTETPNEEPTEEPGDEPTEGPTARPVTTRTDWTCEDASIQDPLKGRWRITQTRWGRQSEFDRLAFDLTRLDGSARRGTEVTMEFLRPARAASRYDVDTPTGDRALVITFDGPINLRAAMSAQPPLTSVGSLTARTDADGVVHAIVGIEGDGCARLVANDWRNGDDSTTTARLLIDIQR
jgi:hypothetical protein